MPQIIGAIIAIIIAIWVIAAIVWIVQWIAACILWFFQVILKPLFLYFTPAIAVIFACIGIYLGSGVAAKNYLISLKKNVNPEGSFKNFIKQYFTFFLTFFLVILFAAFAVPAGFIIVKYSYKFVNYVVEYYNAIRFPGFPINFPF